MELMQPGPRFRGLRRTTWASGRCRSGSRVAAAERVAMIPAPSLLMRKGAHTTPPIEPEPATVERTLILLKPDALHRGLVGPILERFERKGLRIVGMKLRQFSKDLLREHYSVHKERPFFAGLVDYMRSAPVLALALQGVDAISVARSLIGATNGREAAPGTIRGDFGMSFSTNLVHGSDGPESAQKELGLFFGDEGDLVEWTPATFEWTYNLEEEI